MPRSNLIRLRRGTSAQWTAANPVLAAGEPGLLTDALGGMRVGNGVTPWNDLRQTAEYMRMTFKGREIEAVTDTNVPTFTAPTVALPYSGWAFPPNVDSSVLWPFAPPRIGLNGTGFGNDVFWKNFGVDLVWINLGVMLGAVQWRARVRNMAIGIDAVTEAPTVDTTTALSAANQHIVNAGRVATVPVVPGFFGSEWSIQVTRMGSLGSDTLEETALMSMCSFNQID